MKQPAKLAIICLADMKQPAKLAIICLADMEQSNQVSIIGLTDMKQASQVSHNRPSRLGTSQPSQAILGTADVEH